MHKVQTDDGSEIAEKVGRAKVTNSRRTPAKARVPTIVVLAAGLGTRLGEVVDGGPKWLASCGGRRIADRQLDAFAALPGATLLTVVGHRSAEVEAFLKQRRDSLTVRLIQNPQYDRWNNWYSLLLALDSWAQLTPKRPVLLLNGDLVIPETWVATIVADFARRRRGVLLAIDSSQVPGDEAMKVVLGGRSSNHPWVQEIGKQGLLGEPSAEYIGMAMFDPSSAEALRIILRSFEGVDSLTTEWYERSFSLLLQAGYRFDSWPTPHSNWVEVDDQADLERAGVLLKQKDG